MSTFPPPRLITMTALLANEELPFNKVLSGGAEILLQELPENSIDLTVTSPPYDHMRTYGAAEEEKQVDSGFSFPFESIAQELFRITKPGGILVWVVGDQIVKGGESGSSFKQALHFMNLGFRLYDTMIYHKNGTPFPEKKRYAQVFEYMFVFSKGKPKTINLIKDRKNKWAGYENFGKRMVRKKDGSQKEMPKFSIAEYGSRYNVWYYSTGRNYSTKDSYAFQHPAIFPESLAEDHILTWSNPGDVVLDPMCGSGTVLKMAKKNNRNFIGIDINDIYARLSERRVENVQPYTDANPNPKCQFVKI